MRYCGMYSTKNEPSPAADLEQAACADEILRDHPRDEPVARAEPEVGGFRPRELSKVLGLEASAAVGEFRSERRDAIDHLRRMATRRTRQSAGVEALAARQADFHRCFCAPPATVGDWNTQYFCNANIPIAMATIIAAWTI